MLTTPSRKITRPLRNNVRTATLTLAALALAASCTITGCKENKPPAPEAATVPQQPVPAPAPVLKKHLYSDTADPKVDIADALQQARRDNKRVILDFGGDWCGDCQVLDIYFHQAPNAELLDKNFIVVHVNIGRFDRNVDVAEKYKVPIKKGVPALAVLDSHGKLLYSQQNKEFEDMRNMQPESVTEFLNKWKA